MKKVILLIPIKKIIISFLIMLAFIIILPIALVGIGNNKSINNSDIGKYEIKPNDIVFNKSNGGGDNIKVYITKDKKTVEMALEEYVRGVVASEMPADFNIEALKAQAVAARTFALVHMPSYGGTQCTEGNGADICDTVHCQVYMSKEDRLAQWPKESAGIYWNKITDAIKATEGEILTYNGEIVKSPLYFAVSNGRTEDAINVFSSDTPYLKSVSSANENKAQNYKTTIELTTNSLANKINKQYPKAKVETSKLKQQISILSRSEGNSVKNIKLGNTTITGQEFRRFLGLKSADFSFNFASSKVQITCLGSGHDVGMSQWGANIMAQSGENYKGILLHYYTGVSINNLSKLSLK